MKKCTYLHTEWSESGVYWSKLCKSINTITILNAGMYCNKLLLLRLSSHEKQQHLLFKDIGVMTVISQEKIICGELL